MMRTGKTGSVSIPTVLASAGAAAVISAIIVAIGVVGLVATRDSASSTAQPTVVNLGSNQSNSGQNGSGQAAAPQAGAALPGAPQYGAAAVPDGTVSAPAADVAVPDSGPTIGTAPGTPASTPGTQATTSAPAPSSTTGALPANFRVTTDKPTADDLNNIVGFLVATNASDEAKAANIEGGMNAVIVPKTVYTLGLFRPPLGWHKVSEPLERNGDRVTAQLTSGSAGRPTIRLRIEFKKIDDNWRLAANSLCQGVKTVGLNIYCNR